MDEAFADARTLTERRSYDADEVDAYLRKVHAGVIRLKKETQVAVDRTAATERALAEHDEERTAMLGRKVLDTQQALDGAMADARREADALIAEARTRANSLLATAAAEAQTQAATADAADDKADADVAPVAGARCQLCDGESPDHLGLCRSCGGTPDASPPDARPVPIPTPRATPRRRAPVGVGSLTSLFTRRR